VKPLEGGIMKKVTAKQINIACYAGVGIFLVSAYLVGRREEKRQQAFIDEQEMRAAVFQYHTEQLNEVCEDLDERIARAKKALLDDDFYEITKHLEN
jgi:hypothetical protein